MLPELRPELKRLHEEVLATCKERELFIDHLVSSANLVKKPPRNGLFHSPGIVEIPGGCRRYVFVGDLHGDYYTLLAVLNGLWDLLHNGYVMVFLGDYVDRGYMQLETLLLALRLKTEFPENVVLLRGNHEPPPWLLPYPHDYVAQLKARFGSYASDVYKVSLKLFEALPLVLVHVGELIALHGGPPLRVLNASNWQEAFESGSDEISPSSLEEILWSDPVEEIDNYVLSPRGAGVLYGRAISERALQLVKGKLIVRGHEAVNGSKSSHGGRVITVFTSPLVYGLSCGGVITYSCGESISQRRLGEYCVNPASGELILINSKWIESQRDKGHESAI